MQLARAARSRAASSDRAHELRAAPVALTVRDATATSTSHADDGARRSRLNVQRGRAVVVAETLVAGVRSTGSSSSAVSCSSGIAAVAQRRQRLGRRASRTARCSLRCSSRSSRYPIGCAPARSTRSRERRVARQRRVVLDPARPVGMRRAQLVGVDRGVEVDLGDARPEVEQRALDLRAASRRCVYTKWSGNTTPSSSASAAVREADQALGRSRRRHAQRQAEVDRELEVHVEERRRAAAACPCGCRGGVTSKPQ